MRKVVVTGIGLITPIGDGVKETWNSLINSVSGIKKIKHFDVTDLTCKIAGHINNVENDDFYFNPFKYVEKKELKKIDRFILYGIAASKQAIEDSGIDNLNDEIKLKTGVIIGSGNFSFLRIQSGNSFPQNSLSPRSYAVQADVDVTPVRYPLTTIST